MYRNSILNSTYEVGRYLYGDYGLRGDCTRHFGEYAVGVYAMYVEGEVNGGFHFAIPCPERNGTGIMLSG